MRGLSRRMPDVVCVDRGREARACENHSHVRGWSILAGSAALGDARPHGARSQAREWSAVSAARPGGGLPRRINTLAIVLAMPAVMLTDGAPGRSASGARSAPGAERDCRTINGVTTNRLDKRSDVLMQLRQRMLLGLGALALVLTGEPCSDDTDNDIAGSGNDRVHV